MRNFSSVFRNVKSSSVFASVQNTLHILLTRKTSPGVQEGRHTHLSDRKDNVLAQGESSLQSSNLSDEKDNVLAEESLPSRTSVPRWGSHVQCPKLGPSFQLNLPKAKSSVLDSAGLLWYKQTRTQHFLMQRHHCWTKETNQKKSAPRCHVGAMSATGKGNRLETSSTVPEKLCA